MSCGLLLRVALSQKREDPASRVVGLRGDWRTGERRLGA